MLAIKVDLKQLAKKITSTKPEFKDHQRKHRGYAGPFYRKLWDLQYQFRHKHIAYCVFRGTPRDKIEKPADNNQPNESYIKEVLNELQKNVCVSQV